MGDSCQNLSLTQFAKELYQSEATKLSVGKEINVDRDTCMSGKPHARCPKLLLSFWYNLVRFPEDIDTIRD